MSHQIDLNPAPGFITSGLTDLHEIRKINKPIVTNLIITREDLVVNIGQAGMMPVVFIRDDELERELYNSGVGLFLNCPPFQWRDGFGWGRKWCFFWVVLVVHSEFLALLVLPVSVFYLF